MGNSDHELTAAEVDEAIKGLRANGLPAELSDPVGPLLEMRSVFARSVKAEDSLSRLDALNQLLKQLIRKWPRENERRALAALYGVEKGYTGRTHTVRRQQAAEHMGNEANHFRKYIERPLTEKFSAVVWQDHLRYTPRTKYAPPIIEASGDTPTLGPGDYHEQEELVSRIWSEVYGLRAEIIAGALIKKDQARHDQLPEVGAKIRWRTARLLTYITEYLQRYGDRIIQGDTEWRIEGLIRLAGWRGGVGEEEAQRLRLALVNRGEDDWHAFIE